MNKATKFAIIAVLTIAPVTTVVLFGLEGRDDGKSGEAADGFVETNWRVLRGLDLQSGTKPTDLATLDGKNVKIAGFIVPLDDDRAGAEFLLVPSPQACIHVPPPPANQMIMVRMSGGNVPQRAQGPVWISGQLTIASMSSQYGKISYTIRAEKSEPYKIEGG